MIPCVNCNSLTNNPKFCSKSCSVAYNNSRVPKRKKATNRGCKHCGKEVNRASKVYCNSSCQRHYERINRVESGAAGIRCIKSYLVVELGVSSCAVCNHSDWNNKPLTLEIDHIDGNSSNNDLENLRLLCPNCHSQTSTYKNRNKGNGRHYRRTRYKKGKSY